MPPPYGRKRVLGDPDTPRETLQQVTPADRSSVGLREMLAGCAGGGARVLAETSERAALRHRGLLRMGRNVIDDAPLLASELGALVGRC
jgi:hypothetical protein